MRRLGVALCVCAPLAIAGCLISHQLGYLVVSPDSAARSQLLRSDGHGYFREFAFLVPAVFTILTAGFIMSMHANLGSTNSLRLSARPFAAIPLLVFVLQETAERAAVGGSIETLMSVSFVIGLGMQIPFGLIAFLLAQLVLRAAALAGRTVRAFFDSGTAVRRPAQVLSPPRLSQIADQTQIVALAPRRGPPVSTA